MIFHLFFYVHFSLKQTQFLNLTQCLLTYWIIFATTTFYVLLFKVFSLKMSLLCSYFPWNNLICQERGLIWPPLIWCNMFMSGQFWFKQTFKAINVIVTFCIWTLHPQNIFDLLLFSFTNVGLFFITKFVLIKKCMIFLVVLQ